MYTKISHRAVALILTLAGGLTGLASAQTQTGNPIPVELPPPKPGCYHYSAGNGWSEEACDTEAYINEHIPRPELLMKRYVVSMAAGQLAFVMGYCVAAAAEVPGARSSEGPALAGFEGRTVVAWAGLAGVSTHAIWYTNLDGNQTQIPNAQTLFAPALGVAGQRLYLAATPPADDDKIRVYGWDGSAFQATGEDLCDGVTCAQTHASPALLGDGATLYAARSGWRPRPTRMNRMRCSYPGRRWSRPSTSLAGTAQLPNGRLPIRPSRWHQGPSQAQLPRSTASPPCRQMTCASSPTIWRTPSKKLTRSRTRANRPDRVAPGPAP